MTQYRPIELAGSAAPIGIADQPSPMLQWVEIALMVIDDSYQRPINATGLRTIKTIAENFRWSCFTPVLLAPIEGGQFAVIDGQHRVHAALMCGVKSVPAMVVPIAATEQATAFVQVNSARTAMSPLNLYKAGLVAGEPWAVAADKAVADAGCRLMRSNRLTKDKKPGEVYCVGLIRDLVTHGNSRAVTVALSAVRAPAEQAGTVALLFYSNWLLHPLMRAVAEVPGLDAETLTEVLRRHRPFNVIESAERLAKAEKLNVQQTVRASFVVHINRHLAEKGVA